MRNGVARKKWMRRCIDILFVALVINLASSSWVALEAQTDSDIRTFRIGVQATSGATRALEAWRATEDALNAASAREGQAYRFTIVPEVTGGIAPSLQAERIDLLLSDPAAYVLAEVEYGARAILSTARIIDNQTIDTTGALIFSRADTSFSELIDLQDVNVMAVSPQDFSGWWLAAQEFRRFRLEPLDHLGGVMFSGGNEREVVYAVQSGLVDAGIVRAGALEELANAGTINLADFKPISPKFHENFPFWVSTPLYPERVLAALPNIPDPVLSIVINTLLEMDPSSTPTQDGFQIAWQAPANYQEVHELLVSLRAPPYQNYLVQAAARIYAVYRWQILLVLSIVLSSLAFLFYQGRRNWALAEAQRNVLKSERRSKLFYRNAVEEHTVFCMLTREGRISYVNDRFCDIVDQVRGTLVGQELAQFLSERDRDLFFSEIENSMELKNPWSGHLRIKKSDGSFSWVQCTMIPVMGVEDKLSEMALVATDMTTAQMTAVEETFNETLELIEDPVIVLEPKSLEIMYCNRAADETLIQNRVGGTWQNRNIDELITNDDLTNLRAKRDAVVAGPSRRITWEVETKNKHAYEISLEYVIPEMEQPSLVVMYRDISARKAAELAKNEFVSTVSHELRTPLTSMKGALSIATSGMAGDVPDKMKTLLGMASRNTERLIVLINDILDLEKIEAKKMDYNFENLDMQDIVQQAVEANHYYADNLGVKFAIEVRSEDGPFTTRGDRHRLMQVMDNLLSNAAKFSYENSEILIRLYSRSGWIRLSVRDFGTGIPIDAQPKIFGKFVQGDSSDNRAKGGTGLGLAIVKPIVEAHMGAISFYSKEGEGSEFYVDLPRVTDSGAVPVDALTELLAPGFYESTQIEVDPVVTAFTGSVLVEEIERALRRTDWAKELEASRVMANQILQGSGLLGNAIANGGLSSNCRVILSELIERGTVKNSPIYLLEAKISDTQPPALETDGRGAKVLSDWLPSIPGILAAIERPIEGLRVIVIADQALPFDGNSHITIKHFESYLEASEQTELEECDLVIYIQESAEASSVVILPTDSGMLIEVLPKTIIIAQKENKDVHLGVVSRFNFRPNVQAKKLRGR